MGRCPVRVWDGPLALGGCLRGLDGIGPVTHENRRATIPLLALGAPSAGAKGAASTQPGATPQAARKAGGAEGSRTPDLLIANETLYQLSYDPNPRLTGPEPASPPRAGLTAHHTP